MPTNCAATVRQRTLWHKQAGANPDKRTCRWVSSQNRHLRDFNASRDAGFVLAVYERALIIRAAAEGSFAQDGMSPQRISDNSLIGPFGCWRMTRTFTPRQLTLSPRNGPENPARDFELVGTRARRSGGSARNIALRLTTHLVQ